MKVYEKLSEQVGKDEIAFLLDCDRIKWINGETLCKACNDEHRGCPGEECPFVNDDLIYKLMDQDVEGFSFEKFFKENMK